jgi:hypothetical protein
VQATTFVGVAEVANMAILVELGSTNMRREID